jgi:hypothetical protein
MHIKARMYRNPANGKAGMSCKPILINTQEEDHRIVTNSAWKTARNRGENRNVTLYIYDIGEKNMVINIHRLIIA